MAQIVSSTAIAPGAQLTSKEIQTGIARLQFAFTGSALTGWANDLAVTLTLKNRSGGAITLISDLDLYTLSRLRDNDDGGYSIFNFGGAAAANVNLSVSVGFFGANAYLDSNLYLELVIRNASAGNTYTVTVDGYEAPVTRPAYLKYDRINFATGGSTASSDQEQYIGDADRIWVPQTATPWTQLRMSSPSRSTLTMQGIVALRSYKYDHDSLVATDSAGANPLYAASMPAALDGAVLDVRGYSMLNMTYAAAQTIMVRRPKTDLLTRPGSEVYDPDLARRVADLVARQQLIPA